MILRRYSSRFLWSHVWIQQDQVGWDSVNEGYAFVNNTTEKCLFWEHFWKEQVGGLVWEHNYFKRLNSKRILLARWRLFLWNLGERYFPGVGRVSADEFMRREIIHKLCLKPMTHSELVKALPLDNELEDEEGVDGIIESVSTFK